MTSKRSVLCLFALCLLSAGHARAQDHELQEFRLRHQGRTRTYYLYDASNIRSLERPPVLFVLHGGTGSALRTADRNEWQPLADREKLLVIYPDGVDGQWNDGRGVPTLNGTDVTKVDDVGFFRKLFDRAVEQHGADPERIYVTGSSNGGAMTYRLGIELGDRIAAVAAVISTLWEPLAELEPVAPLPVLIMNGTEDPLQAWGGTPPGEADPGEAVHLSTEATVAYWVRNNRRRARPRVSSTTFPDVDPTDGSTVERTVVHRLAAPVVLYTVHGGGHCMPGSDFFVPPFLGDCNQDIEGAEEIWRFLRAHSRD